MIVLTGQFSKPKWGPILERHPSLENRFGQLLSPKAWRHPWCRHYALDNDCFAHQDDPGWWIRKGETAWLKLLDKLKPYLAQGHSPMFTLLPDVVGDWPATLERAWRYRDVARDRGLEVAVALQDGCDFDEATALKPDWVFVGGTTAWKLAAIEPACRHFHPRGVRVHVGRVNGRNRLQACLRCGVQSVDGTGWARFCDKELPKLTRTLDNWSDQLRWAI